MESAGCDPCMWAFSVLGSFTHTRTYLIKWVLIRLNEEYWSSWWTIVKFLFLGLLHIFSCLICVLGFLMSLNYCKLRYLVILSVWGKIHGRLEGLELKIGEEKLEIPYDNPWGAVPARTPQGKIYLTGPGAPRHPERLRPGCVLQALALRASQSAKVTSRSHFFPIFSY